MKFDPDIARAILLDVAAGRHLAADPTGKYGAGIYERHGVLTMQGGLIAGTVIRRRGGVSNKAGCIVHPPFFLRGMGYA